MEMKKEDVKESPIPMLVLLATIALGVVVLIVYVFLGE
jgi:preprotein translocase subunit Sec61beta